MHFQLRLFALLSIALGRELEMERKSYCEEKDTSKATFLSNKKMEHLLEKKFQFD